jgi:hypothetical protein
LGSSCRAGITSFARGDSHSIASFVHHEPSTPIPCRVTRVPQRVRIHKQRINSTAKCPNIEFDSEFDWFFLMYMSASRAPHCSLEH